LPLPWAGMDLNRHPLVTRRPGHDALERVVGDAEALTVARIEWVATIGSLYLMVGDHPVACGLRSGASPSGFDPLALPASSIADDLAKAIMLGRMQNLVGRLGRRLDAPSVGGADAVACRPKLDVGSGH
jgi:hypothetical protein